MNQEFRPHPVITNYEASRDGVVRNRRLKKAVGNLNNRGYLQFNAGGKIYFIHRFIFEVFNGVIEPGLVIDHIDGCPQHNELSNLQAISQSQNLKKGKTGGTRKAKSVKSFDLKTNEEKIFRSINAAGKHFDICVASIRFVAEGIYQTALSKRTGHRLQFAFLNQ